MSPPCHLTVSIAEATAPGVVGANRNPVNFRGGYFPREDLPWWPVPAGSFPWWPVPVQKIPWIPVVVSSRGNSSRGGQLPSETTREFPWWLNAAGKVPKIKNRTRGRPWRKPCTARRKNQASRTDVFPFLVDAIMSTRLPPNHSTCWPIYGVKKNCVDFTIDRLNLYATTRPQVIRTKPISSHPTVGLRENLWRYDMRSSISHPKHDSKKFVRADRPTFLCVSTKTNIVVKLSYQPVVPDLRSSTFPGTFGAESITPTVGWL